MLHQAFELFVQKFVDIQRSEQLVEQLIEQLLIRFLGQLLKQRLVFDVKQLNLVEITREAVDLGLHHDVDEADYGVRQLVALFALVFCLNNLLSLLENGGKVERLGALCALAQDLDPLLLL